MASNYIGGYDVQHIKEPQLPGSEQPFPVDQCPGQALPKATYMYMYMYTVHKHIIIIDAHVRIYTRTFLLTYFVRTYLSLSYHISI